MTMNKDQIDGRVKKSGGKVKEAMGKALGKPSLEFKGKVEQVTGHAQASFGDIQNDLKNREKTKRASK